MKEYLDSDRVNFLVWRYLIEGNYRETAAKLQKEWRIQEPHRHFDFAPHVKNHALVSVLNRGLLYLALERDYASSSVSRDVAAAAAAPPTGVFGPLIPQPPPKDEDLEEPAPEPATIDVENGRKRQGDRQLQSMSNGSPAKRPKLSNGYETGSAADAAPTPMEIDQAPQDSSANNNHAYPSPLEGEQAITPIIRTEGPEQATQVDKVEELSSAAIFLRLGADDPSGTPRVRSSGENPIVLHCEWNPQDPSMLAAAGTDALARVWTLARPLASTGDPVRNHVDGSDQPFEDLMEDDLPRTATVTAMAWSSDGQAIAVATEADNKARISIWAPDGTHLHRLAVAEPPVIKLLWNPGNQVLLGIAPDHGGTLVTVFSSQDSNSASYVIRDHDLQESPLDAAWISDTDFVLCGGDLLIALHCTGGEILQSRKFETQKDDVFSHVQYDARSRLLATASDKGVIDLWDENGQRRSFTAHTDVITCLQWQPLPADVQTDERLLASSSEDGAITIWNVRSPDSRPKYSMTMDLPVVALAFTPDGAFIAGATSDRVLIWKVGEHAIPRAGWSRTPSTGWSSPRMNGDTDDEDTHCLCWDPTGQKLAYGANSRLAVINFR